MSKRNTQRSTVCDGPLLVREGCTRRPEMIDNRGFVYCQTCAEYLSKALPLWTVRPLPSDSAQGMTRWTT